MSKPACRIALLAVEPVWEDPADSFLSFSYGARKVAASVQGSAELGDVEVEVMDFRSRDPRPMLARIQEFRPTLVAGSTYIWSVGAFASLARMVKEWDPTVAVVLGGPAARASVFDLQPYQPFKGSIDALVTTEGEAIIRDLARHAGEDDWRGRVPGLTVPTPLGWRRTPDPVRVELDAFPSPYHLGTAPPGRTGFLETFRGCPMSCSFCQWRIDKADRFHSAEYIADVLRGFELSEATNVYTLDAGFNLNAKAFRNLVAAERETGVLAKRKVHGHIYPTFLREEHVEFFRRLGRANITLGIQSFEKEVLASAQRPYDAERCARVIDDISRSLEIDVEIILGLPGDTPAGFRRTLDRALEIASSIRVFWCLALPDALLERAASLGLEFDPETFRLIRCGEWTPESMAVEWERVVQIAQGMYRTVVGANWVGFATSPDRGPSANVRLWEGERLMPDAFTALQRLARAEGWDLVDARELKGSLVLRAKAPTAVEVTIDVFPAGLDQPRFLSFQDVAYAYRGTLDRETAGLLRAFLAEAQGMLRTALHATPRFASPGFAGSLV